LLLLGCADLLTVLIADRQQCICHSLFLSGEQDVVHV
jgi:hypothetical protein